MSGAGDADTVNMQATVAHVNASTDSSWVVSREGATVAAVDIREDGGQFVVAAGPERESAKPYRFPTLQAADAFLTDLMTSFAYLGCEVARS